MYYYHPKILKKAFYGFNQQANTNQNTYRYKSFLNKYIPI